MIDRSGSSLLVTDLSNVGLALRFDVLIALEPLLLLSDVEMYAHRFHLEALIASARSSRYLV